MWEVLSIPRLVTKISVFIKLRLPQKLKRTRKDKWWNKTWLSTQFQRQAEFLQTQTSRRWCSWTARRCLCIVLMKKNNLEPSDIVDIRWIWTNKYMNFNPTQKELMSWLSLSTITTFFRLDNKDSSSAISSKIKNRRTKLKFLTCPRSSYIPSKSWSDRKSCCRSLRPKIMMQNRREINFWDNRKPNMTGWLMNGISKSQKGKGSKKKSMIEKSKKSVEWKSNSHTSLLDYKFSTRKRDKL